MPVRRPWVKDFGPVADAWDSNGSGYPGVELFGHAVQVWAICRSSPAASVGEAAEAFNVPASLVLRAIEAHAGLELGTGAGLEQRIIARDGL